MEQGQLNKKYWKLTGLTYSIEDLIKDCADKSEEDKFNLYNNRKEIYSTHR